MLKSQNLFEITKLFVIGHLFDGGVSNVPRLSSERKDAVGISADNAQACDRQGLGRVPLGDDQGALVTAVGPGPVGVIQFRDARDPRLFGTIRLLQLLVDQRVSFGQKIFKNS